MYESTERRYTAEQREIVEKRLKGFEEKIDMIAPKAIPGTVLAEVTLKKVIEGANQCREILRMMDEQGVE